MSKHIIQRHVQVFFKYLQVRKDRSIEGSMEGETLSSR